MIPYAFAKARGVVVTRLGEQQKAQMPHSPPLPDLAAPQLPPRDPSIVNLPKP